MLSDKNRVCLLLGSNLGNRLALLNNAMVMLEERVGRCVAQSSVYETAAWGNTDQPGFLNQAVVLQTDLEPLELLSTVLAIELALGRVRKEKWAARYIDIDLIFYGNRVVDVEGVLQLPHPQLAYRRFVLAPIVEIAPDFIHPVLQRSMTELLAMLEDDLEVVKL